MKLLLFLNISLDIWFSHVFGSPSDEGSDGSELFAGLLVFARFQVNTSGCYVLLNFDAVQKHVVPGIDD